MLLGILIILFAWFIEMPLWLSIVATVFGSLNIVGSICNFILKIIETATKDD